MTPLPPGEDTLVAHGEATEPMPAWAQPMEQGNLIVQFDCAEAILFDGTEEEARDLRDDFDCAPSCIIPVEQVEISSLWTKNGWVRVDYRMLDQ